MARVPSKVRLNVQMWLVTALLFVPFVIGAMIASSTPEVSACMDRVARRGAALCLVLDLETAKGVKNLVLGSIVAFGLPGFFVAKDYAEGGPQRRKHRREYERKRRAEKRAGRDAQHKISQGA